MNECLVWGGSKCKAGTKADLSYGRNIKVVRTEKEEGSCRHLVNSLRITKLLEEKAADFDCAFQAKSVPERDCDKLELYVMELLMEV